MRKAFVESLVQLTASDSRVMLIVGDLGFGVTEPFSELYPDYFLNVGVAEQNMTGMAAGMALRGKLVFTYSIANFPTARALEQIRNDVVFHQLPVTIVSVGTGYGYGVLGYSHHALEDIGILKGLPGMRILSPSTDEEVSPCLQLIANEPGPTYLRLDKDTVVEKIAEKVDDISLPRKQLIGDSEIIVLSTGSISSAVNGAILGMDESSRKRFSHYSICQIKPMRMDAKILKGAKVVITVEEHSIASGFGSAVLEQLEGTDEISKVRRIGAPDEISNLVGSPDFLRANSGLDEESLRSQFLRFAG